MKKSEQHFPGWNKSPTNFFTTKLWNFEIVLNAEQLDILRGEDKLPTEVFLNSQCGSACEESYPSWHIAKYKEAL